MIAFLAAAACGGGGGSKPLPDAPVIIVDASVPVDAMPQPVSLTVTQNGKPVMGVHTYFLNPDSSVIAMVDTDATGTASKLMPLGGSVTALDPFAPQAVPARVVVLGNNELRTFVGVKPGDHLLLTQNDAPPSATFTLQAPPNQGANTYDVHTTCGDGTLNVGGGSGGSGSLDPGGSLTLDGCNGAADVVIVARDTVEVDVTTGVLYKAGVPVVDGSTVTLTAADTYAAPTDRTFTYVNTPEVLMTLRHFLVTARGKITVYNNTIGNVVTAPEPTIAGAKAIVDTAFFPAGSEHHIVDWSATVADYTLDPTGVLLPGFDTLPSWDQATNQVTWTEGAGTAVPVLTTTAINVSRNVEERSWRWQISAPYSAGKLAFPTLPTDVADWNPKANDSVQIEGVVNAKVPGGYDAVRPLILNVDLFGDTSALVAGATGRAVVVRSSSAVAEKTRARPALRRR